MNDYVDRVKKMQTLDIWTVSKARRVARHKVAYWIVSTLLWFASIYLYGSLFMGERG